MFPASNHPNSILLHLCNSCYVACLRPLPEPPQLEELGRGETEQLRRGHRERSRSRVREMRGTYGARFFPLHRESKVGQHERPKFINQVWKQQKSPDVKNGTGTKPDVDLGISTTDEAVVVAEDATAFLRLGDRMPPIVVDNTYPVVAELFSTVDPVIISVERTALQSHRTLCRKHAS